VEGGEIRINEKRKEWMNERRKWEGRKNGGRDGMNEELKEGRKGERDG